MSGDTAKENASFVDSSATQKQDAGTLEDPESSSYKANPDIALPKAEEEGHYANVADDSDGMQKDKMYNTRYFIIKSLNHQNIQLSVEKGIWATQVMNEPILEEAFHNSHKVILIFSVNSSGFFQGYAQMMSSVGRKRDNLWSQGTAANNPWGRSFKVNWLRLSNLAFHKTVHLKNPWNDYKPVKISRDCQELSPEIGEALCELIDREPEDEMNFTRNTFHVRRSGIESGCSFPDVNYNISPIDMSWAREPMLYPSFAYQYQAEASRSLLAQHGSAGVFRPENLPFMASKGDLFKRPHHKGRKVDSPVETTISSQADNWPLSGEVNSLCGTLSEDELLAMMMTSLLLQ
uniref:YTH domain-containing family protein n=1 Tax=Opuntia streptacantha TaxID=393608 RepID=A0A7C8YL69_OPUST